MRIAFLAAFLFASTAHAQMDEERPEIPLAPVELHHELVWYGWQIFFSDALAVGLVATNSRIGYLGLALYAGGGPAIHTLQGDPVRAAASLTLRLALPVVGGEATKHDSGDEEFAPLKGILYGALAAMVIDATMLSFRVEEIPVRPAFTPRAGGGVLSLSGRF